MDHTTKRALFCLFVLVGVLGAIAASMAALHVTHGLQAEYYANDRRIGTPALTVIDPDVSTARIVDNWLNSPPPVFSVVWFGYLMIGRPGFYTFATTSDDGSLLTIDGHLVVDNGGRHMVITRTGRIWLDRGPHAVLIEYFQAGGLYEMSWSWAPAGSQPGPVPAWLLSPRRLDYWKTELARVLDWLWLAVAALTALTGSWLAFKYGPTRVWRDVRLHPRLACLALFIVLAIVETWPLATNPARLSRNDNGDTVLNEWVLAWVAHQAPRAPLHLFDANIFFPERDTLAYSEALIVQSAMGAPLLWLGASPVLTYNLLLLAGFALTGWAMCLVVAQWTGDWVAGLASGILFAFNAHTLTRLPHLQAQHVEFLPLALLALDALLREPRAGHAIRLSLWFTLQALTSVYLLVFTAVAMTAAALVRPGAWRGERFWKLTRGVVLAAGLAALALFPFMLPYWHAYHDQGLSRSLEDATWFSASWQDYLSTPGRFHYGSWSYRWFSGAPLFPGALAVALAGVAIARGRAFRDPRARMCLAIGVAGVVLSFGAKVPGYATLHRVVPLFHSIRVVSRFGYLGIFAFAAVAGFGVVEIRRRLPAWSWVPVSVLLLTLITLESLAAPISLSRFDGISPIYRRLSDEPHAVVVEMPFYEPRTAFANAKYMLNSTLNWKPLVNGYSGFQPPSYHKNFEMLSGFPNPASIAALQDVGVTHVFIHLDEVGEQTLQNLSRISALRRIMVDGPIMLYRLDRRDSQPIAGP